MHHSIPRFPCLTRAVAEEAVRLIKPQFDALARNSVVKRHDLHIVVMNPRTWDLGILYQESWGHVQSWEYPYDMIARSKTEMSWRTGKSSCYLQHVAPHLLEIGDTCYWGSDVLDDLVTGASGVQPYYDEFIAGSINLMMRALVKRNIEDYHAKSQTSGHSVNFYGGS